MTSLRATTVFADRGIKVTVVESRELRVDRSSCRQFISGRLGPVAVVVRGPDGTSAFDMDAQSVDIDQLHLPADFELE
jgi:hypothetical protein